MTGGRVIFGVGAGSIEGEFRAMGVPYAERGALTDEALRAMCVLWTEEDPQFEGRYHSISGIKFAPKPAQQPWPPIWVGGMSRAALRRTAEFCDAWHPNAPSLDDVRERQPALRDQWRRFERPGEPPITLRLGVRFFAAPAEGRRHLGRGTLEQVGEDLRAARALGIDDVVVDFALTARTPAGQWNEAFETFARQLLPQLA